MHLPGQFCDVDGEQPFNGRLRTEIAEDDGLKSMILVDVLSRQKLRQWTQASNSDGKTLVD
ncbi:hypothetical protein BST63_00770 [Bradyrhizobium canariense]|uniref:Transposase n=1 Tax=Bradyrhizobium canariense TaxID=255045 RepID=A0ABX3XBF3_9BRAD|nr:hypothetical protein BSR47_00665 [Bradyrhizobium canariense]OSJ36372.1 hypothetical protein BST63_00770 [Bradyrhizobium canariense]